MIDAELQRVCKIIMEAEHSEDIFGVIKGDEEFLLQAIKKTYHRLSLIVHPDRCRDPCAKEMLDEAFAKLSDFYKEAQEQIKGGLYGKRLSKESAEERGFTIKTREREYRIKSTIAEGDISIVYGGDYEDNGSMNAIAVKVVKDSTDNDFMRNEIKILRLFQSEQSEHNKHLPVFLDQFKTNENQLSSILRYIDGYDFRAIREKYVEGAPQEHAAWMLERLLSITGFSHSKGIIHCNIEPSHIIARPRDHNIFLIDWSYAVVDFFHSGGRFKVFNEEYSAPEAAENKLPIPASDLYSIGKCMIYLLGGNIKTNSMPSVIDERFQRLIQFFVRESHLQRAQDSWEMHENLRELRTKIFGPKRFLEFIM